MRAPARLGRAAAIVVLGLGIAAVTSTALTRTEWPMQLGLPAYGYPTTNNLWDEAVQLPPGSIVVLDPADGPGPAPDPLYEEHVRAALANGVHVYGYADTDYGQRPLEAILADVAAYQSWYQPVGIFLDRTPGAAASLPMFRTLAERLRLEGLLIAINPGQPEIDREYAELADQVVNFEGPLAEYRSTKFPSWVRKLRHQKFWHLVYDAGDESAMRASVGLARQNHAGMVFVTDAGMPNPWNRLPPYWAEQLDHLGFGE